jgi:hypothetical protein
LAAKAFHKIRVGKHGGPVRTPVSIVVELPEVDQLINRPRVGLKIANQLLVVPPFLERGVTKLRIQPDQRAQANKHPIQRAYLIRKKGAVPLPFGRIELSSFGMSADRG